MIRRKKNYYSIGTIVLLLITALPLFSQTKHLLSGSIVDKQGNGVDYVNVTLKNKVSEVNTLTDKDGSFSFKLEEGHYTLQAIYFGEVLFEKALDVNADLLLGKIESDPTHSLNEIVVQADKPLVKVVDDKLIFNAQNFKNINGYKAFELMKYLPTVIVSPSREIMIENVPATIFLNGRQLSKDEVVSYLQNMNANEIEKVEIQSTHGGTNDASILGGVINIITKKAQQGFNATLQTYNAFFGNTYNQCLPSMNLFYGKDNWSLYASYSYKNATNAQHAEVINSYTQDSTTHAENTVFYSHKVSHTYRVGMMELVDKVHSFGIEFNGIKNPPITNSSQAMIDLYQNQQKIDDAILKSQYLSRSDFYNLVATYQWKMDTLNSSFKLLANYNNKSNYSSNLVNANYRVNPLLDVNEENISTGKAKNYSIRADVNKKWKSEWELKLGGQYLDTRRLSDYRVDYFDSTDYLPNNWDYREKITSGYLGVSKKIDSKSFLSLSLRLENTNVNGSLSENNEEIKRNYNNLFPYFYFSHTCSNKLSYNLVYSSSIYRPLIYLLNNHVTRISDNLYDVGNPFLVPEIIHKSKASVKYGKSNLSLLYRYTPNAITESFTVKNNITYHSNINSGSKSTWGLNYSFTGNLASWWELNSSLLVAYDRIPNSYNKTHLLYNQTALSNRFDMGKIGVISLDLSVNTGRISGNNYTKPNYVSDISFSRPFLKEALQVRLGVDDIFNTERGRFETRTPELTYTCSMKSFTRNVWINLTYSFSSNKKIKNKRIENDNSIINRL